MIDIELEYETVKEFDVLHNPENPQYNCRYKIFYGGRGGRKSWEIARALIASSILNKELIVCTREIQNSISDSVLRLLVNQIEMLGLTSQFEIQKTTIIGRNGSEFIFKGLNGLTVDGIKSLEGADKCWCEEAHSISEKSWSILIPTIRKPNSQIIISFNPDLATDPVYKRFVLNTPPNSYVCNINYLQNPDCPNTLTQEADYLQRVDYESYSHIWLGEVRAHSDAQIFKGKYTVESFEVDDSFGYPLFGADWGFSNDPTTLVKSYIKGHVLYIRSELYKIGVEVRHLATFFDQIEDARNYTILADNARPELINHMMGERFRIQAADKWAGCVEDRISFMRSFERIVIHPDCKHTSEEFRLYSYKIDKRTNLILPEIVSLHDHCCDAIGYSLTPLIRKISNDYIL